MSLKEIFNFLGTQYGGKVRSIRGGVMVGNSQIIEQMKLEDVLNGPGHPSAFHSVMTPSKVGHDPLLFAHQRKKYLRIIKRPPKTSLHWLLCPYLKVAHRL